MRPFLAILLIALTLFACHKGHEKSSSLPPYKGWRWVSYSLPGGGLLQPARDSTAILYLYGDSSFNILVNNYLLSWGSYTMNRDSGFMTFSTPALLYPPDSLRLCTGCALTISRDTITLRPPLANPTNYGTFTFVRSDAVPACINCSL